MPDLPTGTLPNDPGDLIIHIEPTMTIEDILAALHRQGVDDLDDVVDRSLDYIKKKEDAAHGEDDAPWEKQIFVSDHYVYVHGGVPQAVDQ